MDFYSSVFELIDTRSFTSMWFWLVLAVFWSMMSHFVLGVPFDLIQRALRLPPSDPAWADLEALARINAKRLFVIGRTLGLAVAAITGFMLSGLFILGFFYGVEFCQALFLLFFPFTLVGLFAQKTARTILTEEPHDLELVRVLKRQRFFTQAVGMVAIFVTAFWGVFHAMQTGVL